MAKQEVKVRLTQSVAGRITAGEGDVVTLPLAEAQKAVDDGVAEFTGLSPEQVLQWCKENSVGVFSDDANFIQLATSMGVQTGTKHHSE